MSAEAKREYKGPRVKSSVERGIGHAERMRDRPDAFKATDQFYRSVKAPTRAENDHLARTDRNELARRNIPLVIYTVSNLLQLHHGPNRHRFNAGGAKIGFGRNDRTKADDLIQDGTLGLIRAAETFDPDRGFTFPTYALPWIINHIEQGASRQATVSLPVPIMRDIRVDSRNMTTAQRESARRVIGGFTDLDKPVNGGDDGPEAAWQGPMTVGDSIEAHHVDQGDEMTANAALDALDPLERRVVEHRYGIVGAPLDLQATGRLLGLERIEVRRIERNAMKKMQAAT